MTGPVSAEAVVFPEGLPEFNLIEPPERAEVA